MLGGDCRRYKDQINKFGVGLVHDKTVRVVLVVCWLIL